MKTKELKVKLCKLSGRLWDIKFQIDRLISELDKEEKEKIKEFNK